MTGQRLHLIALLAVFAVGCAPTTGFDDSPRNVQWREVLLVAGVRDPLPIRELSLDQAGDVLGPCLSIEPSCADAVLESQPDLRGAALADAWPYSLRDMAPRFVPILLARGAVADERAMIEAMLRPREHSAQRLIVIGRLLAAGAAVDAPDFDEETPLHHAADQADADLVRLLLQHGADPHRKDRTGSTALQLAQAQGANECVELLRAAMPDAPRGPPR